LLVRKVLAAIFKAMVTLLVIGGRPFPMISSPLTLLSGHNRNQETKWSSVFHLLISHLRIVIAVMISIPFGVILFEMLTGSNFFLRGTTADTMSAILKEDVPRTRAIGRSAFPSIGSGNSPIVSAKAMFRNNRARLMPKNGSQSHFFL
jgi:hypothetical protein